VHVADPAAKTASERASTTSGLENFNRPPPSGYGCRRTRWRGRSQQGPILTRDSLPAGIERLCGDPQCCAAWSGPLCDHGWTEHSNRLPTTTYHCWVRTRSPCRSEPTPNVLADSMLLI